jgi:hypothetical protein
MVKGLPHMRRPFYLGLLNGLCLDSISKEIWNTPFCFAKRSRGTRTPSVALRLTPRAVPHQTSSKSSLENATHGSAF